MSPALWAAFAAATAVLMLIPGPNFALIVANSLRFGVRAGLLTVAGTSAAMVAQLAVASLGVTAIFGALSEAFGILRWLGVAYLVWLGVRAWAEPAGDLSPTRAAPPSKTFGRGFFVSLTNPKTLAFYAAFLPQFLDASAPLGPQMAILSLTFVAIALAVDSGWAILAGRARGLVARFGRARNRLTGAVLIGAALGLALARRYRPRTLTPVLANQPANIILPLWEKREPRDWPPRSRDAKDPRHSSTSQGRHAQAR